MPSRPISVASQVRFLSKSKNLTYKYIQRAIPSCSLRDINNWPSGLSDLSPPPGNLDLECRSSGQSDDDDNKDPHPSPKKRTCQAEKTLFGESKEKENMPPQVTIITDIGKKRGCPHTVSSKPKRSSTHRKV